MSALFILAAEDDENDAFFLRRTVECVAPDCRANLVIVPSGEDLIETLGRDGTELPRMVLLDLKMPGCGGFGALEWIRSKRRFDDLAVVVLTSSNQPRDLEDVYRLGANGYVMKPGNADHLRRPLQAAIELVSSHTGPFARTWLEFSGNPRPTNSAHPFTRP